MCEFFNIILQLNVKLLRKLFNSFKSATVFLILNKLVETICKAKIFPENCFSVLLGGIPDYFLDHDSYISPTYFQISSRENPDINYFQGYEPSKQIK